MSNASTLVIRAYRARVRGGLGDRRSRKCAPRNIWQPSPHPRCFLVLCHAAFFRSSSITESVVCHGPRQRVLHQLFKKSGLMLMERFPTVRSYATTDEEQLASQLRRCSRGRLGNERAQRLISAARDSVGVGAGLKTRSWVLRRAVQSPPHHTQKLGEDDVHQRSRPMLECGLLPNRLLSVDGQPLSSA